ncbi:MAG: metal-sensing transcriptional repressor, partial [Thaumarchaeota archaeon]|nr:metal-sensing transcriptional repressor [Nitrososphaerota archaeon]
MRLDKYRPDEKYCNVTHHKLPEVKKRLARIEGHVKGISKMIDGGKGY